MCCYGCYFSISFVVCIFYYVHGTGECFIDDTLLSILSWPHTAGTLTQIPLKRDMKYAH